MVKKVVSVLLVFVIMAAVFTSCKTMIQKREEAALKLDKFDLDLYMEPYWEGDLMIHESLMFIDDGENGLTAHLMYEPVRIVSVRNSALAKEYVEGVDYTIDGKNITLLKTGSMPYYAKDEYYPKVSDPKTNIAKVGGGFLILGFLHPKQISVTYRHKGEWTGPKPTFKGNLLPKTVEKLKNKESFKIVFYGDSITTGGDSSALHKVAPFAPIYPEMATLMLEKLYENEEIDYKNTAVGGTNSTWGKDNAKERVADLKPDLAVIAFGMNDGTQNQTPAVYRKNIEKIIETTLASNPDCEFLLISTMIPNKDVFYGGGSMIHTHREFAPELLSLEKEGIAVLNFTEISDYMLTLKDFKDMTGNNVNHPNDFLARLYAQSVVATLYDYNSK